MILSRNELKTKRKFGKMKLKGKLWSTTIIHVLLNSRFYLRVPESYYWRNLFIRRDMYQSVPYCVTNKVYFSRSTASAAAGQGSNWRPGLVPGAIGQQSHHQQERSRTEVSTAQRWLLSPDDIEQCPLQAPPTYP